MNAYGILHNYDRPIYTPDFDFIQRALTYKQGTYNQNKARLDQVYSQLESLSVIKGVDQKHIDDRLKMIYNVTDKYATMDLSDTPFVDGIIANMNQLFDDPTKNAVLSTRTFRMEDAKWDWYKENQPEKYSEMNRKFATEKIANRQAYLDDQNVGSRYKGGADFIEYVDLPKNATERLMKAADKFEIEHVVDGSAEGYFRHKLTKKTVPMDKLRDYYDMTMSDAEKRQAGINAWGVYDRMDDNVIRQEYDTRLANYKAQNDREIKDIQLKLNGSGYSEEQRSEMRAEIDRLQSIQNGVQNYNYDKMVATFGRESTYTQLYSDKVKDKITGMFYRDNVVKDELDAVHAKNVEFKRQIERDKIADEKWSQEFGLKERTADRSDLELRLKYPDAFDEKGNYVGNGGDGSGGKNIFTPLADDDDRKTELENKESNIVEFFGKQSELYQDVEKMLMGKGYSAKDVGEIVYAFNRDKEFNFENFEWNGKRSSLSQEDVEKLNNYRDRAMQASKINEKTFKDIDFKVDNLTKRMAGVAWGGNNGVDATALRNERYGYFVSQDNNGNLVFKKDDTKEGMNYILLRKKYNGDKLTKAEETTLRMYTTDKMLKEGSGDKSQQVLLIKYRQNMMLGISNSGIVSQKVSVNEGERNLLASYNDRYSDLLNINGSGNATPEQVKEMKELRQKIEGYRGISGLKSYFSAYDAFRKNPKGSLSGISSLIKADSDASLWFVNRDGSFASLKALDANYVNRYGDEVNDQSFNDLTNFKSVIEKAERTIKDVYAMQPYKYETTVSANSKIAKVIASQGGFAYDKNTIIKISKSWNKEKQDFDPLKINYTVINPTKVQNVNASTKGFDKKLLSGTLDDKTVELNDLQDVLRDAKRTPYDVKYGEYALSRSLGTNYMSEYDRKNNAVALYGKMTMGSDDAFSMMGQYVMAGELSKEDYVLANEKREKYLKGGYTFSLSPNKARGVYTIDINENGKTIHSYSVSGLGAEVSQAEVNRIQGVYKMQLLDDAFSDYLVSSTENDNIRAKILKSIK